MDGAQIHLGIKLAYTLFLLILVPVYWAHYGPRNFLWFSDIALLGMGAALWLESGLLASMMMLAVLLPELVWNLDFFGRLLTGHRMFGMSAYMFERAPGRASSARSPCSTCRCRSGSYGWSSGSATTGARGSTRACSLSWCCR